MKVKNFSIIAFALGIIIGLCHLEPLSTMLTNYLKMSAVTAGNLLFLAVSAIFVIYLLAVRKKTALKDDEPLFKSSSAWPKIFAGLLGLLLLFSSGYDILNALVPKEGPVSIPLFLTGLCALGAGIFFLLAIYLHSIGKQHYGGIVLISLFPSVWMIATILTIFMELTKKADINHYYADIVAMLAILLFLFSLSKALAGLGKPFTILLSGILTVFLAVGTAIPNMLSNTQITFSKMNDLIFLLIGLYAASVLPTVIAIHDKPVSAEKEEASGDAETFGVLHESGSSIQFVDIDPHPSSEDSALPEEPADENNHSGEDKPGEDSPFDDDQWEK